MLSFIENALFYILRLAIKPVNNTSVSLEQNNSTRPRHIPYILGKVEKLIICFEMYVLSRGVGESGKKLGTIQVTLSNASSVNLRDSIALVRHL